MDKLKTRLNSIGLALLGLALIALKGWPQSRLLALILGILGIAALAGYVVLHAGDLKQGHKRRSLLYSSNLILMIVLILAILALINVLGARHHKRFDFTEAKVHSLSDQSITVAKALTQDVQIKAFFREGNYGRARLEDLLRIYAYHSPRIKYEFIDPDKNPGLVKRYEVTQDGTSIFECGKRDTRITETTEEAVTNAVIKVTREKSKTILFLEGHGEKSIEATDENGISFAKDELAKLGYQVKKQTLALPEALTADCALLVVPGPQKNPAPAELEAIAAYLKAGGRVLFLVDPQTGPGLPAFLAGYGFKLEDDIVFDRPSILGGDYLMPVMSELAEHAITRNFRYATVYPLARSVDVVEPKPEGVASAQVLGKTGNSAYAKKGFVLKPKMTVKDIAFDGKVDKRGPLPLAGLAVLKAAMDAAGKAGPEGRLVVFGDSDFAGNRLFDAYGNGNLFLNAANWLTEEADLISIRPKTQNPRTIQLTPGQGRTIFWFSVVLLPLLVLAVGLGIWLRRRAL
ncbi:MAG: GldG family protein [Acidobacteriota bacterium]|nr:GldG family protein [Acidobacteriota bacterium]